MYKDILLKLDYHKKHIINSFIKRGYFPNKEEIDNKLEQINTRLALFKKEVFVPGEVFNTKEINHMLKMIYTDIVFLYKILEEIQKEEFNRMVLNIETHMINLEAIADNFKKRANEEINGTALGKTLLFKSNEWEMEFSDDSVSVNIGELELVQGSEISCFANINNTDKKNIVFEFNALDSKYDFLALPYNYNNDTYIVPGKLAVKEQELTLEKNFNINSEIKIPFPTNPKNKYTILGGKNKMVITDKETNSVRVTDIPTSEKPFIANKSCFITFYVEGKGNIEYTFNKKPLHSNFSIQDGLVKIEKEIQKIFLDVDEGFVCYFNFSDEKTQGWSTVEYALPYDNYLIYDGMILVRDFKVKEYIRDKSTLYKIKLKINETDNDEVLDCVYIKEVE